MPWGERAGTGLGSAGSTGASTRGRSIVNVAPRPGALSTETYPLLCLTTRGRSARNGGPTAVAVR
jgi:hypothetical protein